MKLPEIHIHIHNHGLGEETILAAIDQVKELIMATQDQLDALASEVETAKTEIVTKIEEETQQVQDFIASHPDLDTTALESAVAGLQGLAGNVSSIFPDAPAPTPDPEPVP